VYVVLQIAMNVAIGPYQAIIPDFVERGRFGIASSWMAALQSLGNAIGALCASVVADARVLGALLAALLLGSAGVTSLEIRRLPLEAHPQDAPVRVNRAFVDLFISRALVYVGFFTLVGYLLFYVTGVLGVPPGRAAQLQSGMLILAFTLIGAAGAAVAAKPSDRRDKRVVATAGGALFVAALIVFIASHTMAGAIAATALAGLGWGIFLVADWAIACRILPPAALAATMGIWNLALILPQIAAPLITTWVLGRLSLLGSAQGPRVAFGLAVGETVLGIAWLWRLSRCALGE
jgi:MFS family permease